MLSLQGGLPALSSSSCSGRQRRTPGIALVSAPSSKPLTRALSGHRRVDDLGCHRTVRLHAFPLSASYEEVAMMFFGTSIVPYSVFLYFLTKSKQAPGVLLFGFYFLLVFVFATIPAGILAKRDYGTILANVDWLHGTAESLLTITNLLIVFGLRQGFKAAQKSPSKALQEPVEKMK